MNTIILFAPHSQNFVMKMYRKKTQFYDKKALKLLTIVFDNTQLFKNQ
jgi:hypothetical protein